MGKQDVKTGKWIEGFHYWGVKKLEKKILLFLLCSCNYESVSFFPLQSRRVKDEEKDVSQLSLSPTPALKPAFSFSFKNSLIV